MIVDSLIAVLGYEIKPGSEAARRKMEGGMDRLERKARDVSIAMTKIGLGIAAVLTPAAAALGRGVVNVSAQFERFEAQLTTTLGDNGKAKAALGWIEDFTAKTPYELAKVVEAFSRLTTQGLDPLANDTLKILGDTAAAMGEPLERAVEAFTDASQMEFERLKAFGVRAKQEGDSVTFVWTKNGEELTRTLKKNGEDIRRFLLENFGERFAGAMELQNKTYDGMLSNLGDAWTSFKRRIGDAGFFDTVKGKLQGMLDGIARLDASGALDRWAKSISDVLSMGTNAAGAVFGQLAGHLGALQRTLAQTPDGAVKWAKALAALAGWRLLALFPVSRALGALAFALDEIATTMRGGESKLNDFLTWFDRWAGLVPADGGSTATGITVAGTSLRFFAENAERAVAAVERMMAFFDAETGWQERLDSLGDGAVDLLTAPLPEGAREAIRDVSERGGAFGSQQTKLAGGLKPRPGSALADAIHGRGMGDLAYRKAIGDSQTYLGTTGSIDGAINAMRSEGAANISNTKTVNLTVNSSITQQITQATDAPAAAASALPGMMGEAARTHVEGVQ